MANSEKRNRRTAFRLLGLQAVVLFLISVAGYWANPITGFSLLVGGGIGIAANSWLVLVIFRPRSAGSPEALLWSLYLGEVGKFLFVMAFFAIAFKSSPSLRQPTNALMMLMAFMATQVLHWLWPLIQKTKISRNK